MHCLGKQSLSSSSTNSYDKNNDTNNNQIRKPKIHAYADDEYNDGELLKIWIESWKNTVWDTNVLNIENTQLHPKSIFPFIGSHDFTICWKMF